MIRVLHPYIREAASRNGTCVRYVMEGSRYRSHREIKARREIWGRLRTDGFSLPAIALLTDANHTSVLTALRKVGWAHGDGVSGD